MVDVLFAFVLLLVGVSIAVVVSMLLYFFRRR